jgi:hypothetical protein
MQTTSLCRGADCVFVVKTIAPQTTPFATKPLEKIYFSLLEVEAM